MLISNSKFKIQNSKFKIHPLRKPVLISRLSTCYMQKGVTVDFVPYCAFLSVGFGEIDVSCKGVLGVIV
jgi:hypothetical protein